VRQTKCHFEFERAAPDKHDGTEREQKRATREGGEAIKRSVCLGEKTALEGGVGAPKVQSAKSRRLGSQRMEGDADEEDATIKKTSGTNNEETMGPHR